MLSYRHGFHAGNHADVLKHMVLVGLVRLLTRKEKPLLFVDTHAGAGTYSLTQGFALKGAEFRTGIARLWQRRDLPPLARDYVAAVRALNADGALRSYPGSPRIAFDGLRAHDRLRLFELHSTEAQLLQQAFATAGRRVGVTAGDGFAGLKALLPPPSRRGLVLIDPSYEVVADYRAVVTALRGALQRFATGTYAIWYPLLARREAQALPAQLARAAGTTDWVDATLEVRAPSADGLGLHGSGIFIVNPPWTLSTQLRAVLPWLAGVLAQDDTAQSRLHARES